MNFTGLDKAIVKLKSTFKMIVIKECGHHLITQKPDEVSEIMIRETVK